MEDLRQKRHTANINNKAKIFKILNFFTKNWIKIVIALIIISTILYPHIIGSVLGNWLNSFVTSFLSKITF